MRISYLVIYHIWISHQVRNDKKQANIVQTCAIGIYPLGSAVFLSFRPEFRRKEERSGEIWFRYSLFSTYPDVSTEPVLSEVERARHDKGGFGQDDDEQHCANLSLRERNNRVSLRLRSGQAKKIYKIVDFRTKAHIAHGVK